MHRIEAGGEIKKMGVGKVLRNKDAVLGRNNSYKGIRSV